MRGDLTYAYRHVKTSVKASYLFLKARVFTIEAPEPRTVPPDPPMR
jgi:hypothetical protein